MALLDLDSTRRSRFRVFVRGQLPFLLGVVFVAIVAAFAAPARAGSPFMLTALALVAAASAAALVLPWERFPPTWLIVVPLIDIVAVAFMRVEMFALIPAASTLAVFPAMWLAYGFRTWMIVIAVAGAGFISSFPFLVRWEWPNGPVGWANVVTLPVIIGGVALVANLASRQLRRNRARVLAAQEVQAAALRQARDNEILVRSILNTVNAGMAFYGPSNELAMANGQAAKMTELVGFRLDKPPYAGELALAADRVTPVPFEDQIIPRALRGEILTDHFEWLGPPDQQIAILASSRRVNRGNGDLLGTVIIAYDVTELATAVEVREEFLRTVSHELRTPLTNITGYLELLEDEIDESPERSRRHLAVIERNAEVLHERIRELLAATEASEPPRLQTTDVRELVATALADVRDRAEPKGITLEHLDSVQVTAEVDRSRMRQAIGELLINAIKFSPAHSTVTIGQSGNDGSVEIRVADLGPGIGRADRTKVFDRFYRTAFARQQAIQGFGIGLTMVKSTVAAHHGRIHLEDGESGGTVVVIELPQVFVATSD